MKYLDDFYKHLKSINYSNKTISQYQYILKKAECYFNERKINDEKCIKENDIIDFIKYLKTKKTTDGVYYKLIIHLRKYFRYLEHKKIILINPLTNIENPKEIKRPTKIITQQEAIDFLSNIKATNNYGIRAKAIFELLYSSSLRPSEALNIKLNEIDYQKQIIFIRNSKNNKDRVVPVGNTALHWIKKYIQDVRPKYIINKDSNYLFVPFTKTGNKLDYETVYVTLKNYIKKYSATPFCPFSLRPSSATHLLQNGMNTIHLKNLLGHDDIRITQIYLRASAIDLKQIFNKKHPRNNFKKLKENKKCEIHKV